MSHLHVHLLIQKLSVPNPHVLAKQKGGLWLFSKFLFGAFQYSNTEKVFIDFAIIPQKISVTVFCCNI